MYGNRSFKEETKGWASHSFETDHFLEIIEERQ